MASDENDWTKSPILYCDTGPLANLQQDKLRIDIYIEEKTLKNVKNNNRFRVALKSTETRKSQLCPLHIG